ncbi:hypothetical protein [Amycolatopsis sp. NPDC004169]|uniref:hypothetical protein n=1 Tax=Amycolatopsis sp. NPDC004169 TaxID=3154453 RepID=UPI0033ABE22F
MNRNTHSHDDTEPELDQPAGPDFAPRTIHVPARRLDRTEVETSPSSQQKEVDSLHDEKGEVAGSRNAKAPASGSSLARRQQGKTIAITALVTAVLTVIVVVVVTSSTTSGTESQPPRRTLNSVVTSHRH